VDAGADGDAVRVHVQGSRGVHLGGGPQVNVFRGSGRIARSAYLEQVRVGQLDPAALSAFAAERLTRQPGDR
jgi:hypothetical protein